MARKKRRTTNTKKSKRSSTPALLNSVSKSKEVSVNDMMPPVPPLIPGAGLAGQHSDLHYTGASSRAR